MESRKKYYLLLYVSYMLVKCYTFILDFWEEKLSFIMHCWLDVLPIVLIFFFFFFVETEARVTLGSPPPCSGPETGHLWFNVPRKDLFICDGLTWTTLLQSEAHTEESFSKCIFNSNFNWGSCFLYTCQVYNKSHQSQYTHWNNLSFILMLF